MSRHINVQFEVRDMLIMKDTLKEMGFNYADLDEGIVEIERPSITINANEGSIECDSANQKTVDSICHQYMINFYKDKAIREGNKIRQETTAKGETIITVLR